MVEEGNAEECKLLSGFFSYFLQSFLALLALGTLLYKRKIEKPQRDFVTWGFDVTKQVVGSLLVHVWNIALAIVINYAHSASTKPHADECALYFVSYWIDVLVGTAAIIIMLEVIQSVAVRMGWTTIARSGDYGIPPSWKIFFIQTSIFIAVLLIVKTILAIFLLLFDGPIESIANATLKPVLSNPNIELVFVMIISPVCGNILSFWVLDQVIKSSMGSHSVEEHELLL